MMLQNNIPVHNSTTIVAPDLSTCVCKVETKQMGIVLLPFLIAWLAFSLVLGWRTRGH